MKTKESATYPVTFAITTCDIPQKSAVFTMKNIFENGRGVTKDGSIMATQFNTNRTYRDIDKIKSTVHFTHCRFQFPMVS